MNEQQPRDREIRAAFEARADGAPSAELAERISTAARRTRQQRALGWLPDVAARNGPRLLWAAVISAVSLGLLGIVLVVGRQDERLSTAPSSSPSASLAGSEQPSAPPSLSPSPLATPFQAAYSVDAFVAVAIPGGIPIRAQPDPTSATMDPYLFSPNVPLLVVEGPIPNGGVEWYYLVPALDSGDVPGGWAPATDNGNPVLVPVAVECPSSPMTSAKLIAIRTNAVLGCFNGAEITIGGQVMCIAGPAPESAPTWTRTDRHCLLASDPETYPVFGDAIFDMVPRDAAEGTTTEGRFELTGHFDDQRCHPGGDITDEMRLGILSCRSSFIVTGINPTGIALDTVVRTVVDTLRVRSAPGLGTTSAKLESLLTKGTKLFVVAGPITRDDYDWYQVMPFDAMAASGWVAWADHDGTPWLKSDDQVCPSVPLDATELLSLAPYGGLACYHGDEIQLLGDIHCALADVDRVYSGPDWLRHDRYCTIALGGGQTMEFLDGGIQGLGLPTTGRALVTGHFDDPQATSCVYGLQEPPFPDPATVVVNCRSMFVASDLGAAP